MSGSKCVGRIDLGSLLTGLAGGALVAVLVFFLSPGPGRAPDNELPRPAADVSGLEAALAQLDQRLARIEAALAVQESRGGREEVKAGPIPGGDPTQLGATPGGSDELRNDLRQLSNRVDALAESLKENHKPTFQLPTLEQMRSARRDVDAVFLEDIRKLWFENPSAAFERVRLMSFDDVLAKVGPPAKIDMNDGSWWYNRPGTMGLGLVFRFTRDYVVGVRAVGDP